MGAFCSLLNRQGWLFAFLTIAALCWSVSACKGQTKNYQDLTAELNSTEGQYAQASTIGEQIQVLTQSIAIRDSLIGGLREKDSSFRAGSELQNATPAQVVSTLDSLIRLTLDRRFTLSQRYQDVGDFQRAVDVMKQVVVDAESLDGRESILFINNQLRMNEATWLLEADESAMQQYELVKQLKDTFHQEFKNQKYETAAESLSQATETLEKLGLTNTIAYGEAIANYAEALSAQKKYEQAEAVFEKAIDVNDRLFNKLSRTNAQMRRSFSNVFANSRRYEKAIAMLVEADELSLAIGDINSFDRAVGLYLKSNHLEKLKKYCEATRTIYVAVNMLIQIKDNRLFDALQDTLYKCYLGMNDVVEPPEALAEKAVEIGNKCFDGKYQDVVNWLLTIAKTKKNRDEMDNCIAIYERTARLLESNEGFEKLPIYLACLNDIAVLYEGMNQFEKAILFAHKALACVEKTAGKNTFGYANSLLKLSVLYFRSGEYDRAETMFSELDEFWGKQPDQSQTHQQLILLRAKNFHQAKNFKAEIEQLKRLDSIQANNPNVEKSERVKTLTQLVEAYELSGQSELAAATQEEIKRLSQ